MLGIYEVTEADEAATSKDVALANLREQVAKQETQGVIAMYERAAWNAGASTRETGAVYRERYFSCLPLARLRMMCHNRGIDITGLDSEALVRRLAAQ
jgi:hypothetical protein